jgi:hypothetical protein
MAKMLLLILVVYIHVVASKRAIIKQLAKNLCQENIALSVCDVYQCIVAIDIAKLCILFGGGPGINAFS